MASRPRMVASTRITMMMATTIANKVRHVATKDFHAEGRLSQATLFGQQLFRKGGKIITVTEGELDAVSVYQMTGNKWPCVSIRRGAGSAVKDAKAQFEFLDSYDTIVICFDNDDVGREAAVSLAQIFEQTSIVVKANHNRIIAVQELKLCLRILDSRPSLIA